MASPNNIAKANTEFCLDLLRKISEDDQTSNIFFSPFSISAALAMVMLGTGGNTHTQMSEVLCFTEADKNNPEEQPGSTESPMQTQSPMFSQMQTRRQMQTQLQQKSRLPQYLLKCLKSDGSADSIHDDFSKLLKQLQEMSSLKLANRLYGEQTFTFLKDFLKDTRDKYLAELESVDFKTKFDDALTNINGWVEENTEGKIKNLLPEGSIDAFTVLVLVNAIYFKEKWLWKFNKEETVDAPFKMYKSETKTVRMMRQKREFMQAEVKEAQVKVLEMPYAGNELSMIILLPDEDEEDDTNVLEKLEKELTYDKLMAWIRSMTEYEVDVKLPQFKLEQMYDMKDILISMGMVDAFDVSKSNFTGMSTANNLVVSKVAHKAWVEVNEDGTESAAATAAVIANRSVKIPCVFNADHPFLFFILHKSSESVLFAGRYSSPE